MRVRLRVLLPALCGLCLALACLAQSLTPREGRTGWSLANATRPSQDRTHAAHAVARAADFDHAFAPVPEFVWTDRKARLPEPSFRDVCDRLATAGLNTDDLRREQTRLGDWLSSHRADTALDLAGAWHAARRLVDRDLDREYETNRRKRKLLGELLAGMSE